MKGYPWTCHWPGIARSSQAFVFFLTVKFGDAFPFKDTPYGYEITILDGNYNAINNM